MLKLLLLAVVVVAVTPNHPTTCNSDADCANFGCHHSDHEPFCKQHHHGGECACDNPHQPECSDVAGCAGVLCPAYEQVMCVYDYNHAHNHNHCLCHLITTTFMTTP